MMEKELLKKETSLKMSESRIGKITAKRQITIPKDYYDKLGFVEDNVEIILDNNELRIRKYKKIEESHDDYADLILKSILDEGIQNKDEILKEFRLRMNLLPLAAQDLIQDVREKVSHDRRSSEELDIEVFGDN